MASIVRKIGLSLGADICWPLCYQELMKQLDVHILIGKDTLRFEVENVEIEPFDLQQSCPYTLVIDRLTHWYHTTREWIKKSVLMDDLYVFNNPWSVQSMEKQTTYCAMMRLGLPVPETWMVPPKEYAPQEDLHLTLTRYAKLFELTEIGDKLGYPHFIKPYDGGGWKGVSRIQNADALSVAYEQSGQQLMHLQKAVDPYQTFVRCIGLGPQMHFVKYDPSAPHHDRYTLDRDFLSEEDKQDLRDTTLCINTFFGWDFNSCECLSQNGIWHPIDFANPCPDSQVTSLHYHFPWIILANIRWSVFCAATKRPMHRTLDWQTYYDAYDKDMTLRERLRTYGKIAAEKLETEKFEAFCHEHLAELDELALAYFASDHARDAMEQKVRAVFPPHEVESFSDLFWDRIQKWREDHRAEVQS